MKKYAILIAVGDYLDPDIANVAHAEHDAEEFSKVLAIHGFDKSTQLILINSQATKGVIESKVRKVINRLRKDDILYFYYAGHGFSKDAKNFITCYDTIDSDWDGTSVALAPIFDELQASECERIVLFLDCGDSGAKATNGMREIDANFNEQELETFLDNAQHCTCFTACRSDEGSWSSNILHHGIWTYHIIEAFNGDAPLALERGLLTANSLQNYLKSEVPRTLLKTYTTSIDQTPWMYGASSGDFALADLRDILEARGEKASKGGNMVTEMSFAIEEPERLRSLSGWKNSHRIPDSYNQTTEAFVVSCAVDELKADLDRLYQQLKNAFGFTRRQLEASETEDGTGTIITPYFNYSVTITLNPDELDEVIWTRTVDAIKVPQQIVSEAFASVFDDVFDTLEFSLPTQVDIEEFIDSTEAAEIPDLTIKHDREATYCELQLQGAVGTVTLNSQSLSIVHDQPQGTQQLIESFDIVRMLVQKHNLPLIFFTAPVKKLPSASP